MGIVDFLWFARTNFCGTRWPKFLLETSFLFAIFCSSVRKKHFYFVTFVVRYVKMWHRRRPSKWCSFRWPFLANLMYCGIAVHLTFYVLDIFFVCATDYPLYLSSRCFFKWKMFLVTSNVYRPSGANLLEAEFLSWLKGVNVCDVSFCEFLFRGN